MPPKTKEELIYEFIQACNNMEKRAWVIAGWDTTPQVEVRVIPFDWFTERSKRLLQELRTME